MKKDKLYTVNKYNKKNLFAIGGLRNEALAYKHANPWTFADDEDLIQQYMQTDAYKQGKNMLGITRQANPFSRMNVGNTVGALGPVAGQLGNTFISDGYSTGAGSAISGIGSTVGGAISTVNPLVGGIVSAGSGIIGGLANRAFGVKVNQAKLNQVNTDIAGLNSFTSNASSFDDIQGPQAVGNVRSVYKGGWFSGSKARRKNAELRQKLEEAKSFANRNVENNIMNIADDQVNNSLANYAAFGGPLGLIGDSQNMGAIEYGFMSDWLANKKAKEERLEEKQDNNILMGEPLSTVLANGGKIEIKHPGRLTALKKRTGKTEAELYNDGNPAHKKMVVFARNARKWKKAYGGLLDAVDNLNEAATLFEDGGAFGEPKDTVVNDATYVAKPLTKEVKREKKSFWRPNDKYLYEGIFTGEDTKPFSYLERDRGVFEKRYLTQEEADAFEAKKRAEIARGTVADMLFDQRRRTGKNSLDYYLGDVNIVEKDKKPDYSKRYVTKEQADIVKGMINRGIADDVISNTVARMLNDNYKADVNAGRVKGVFALGGDLQTHGADWSDGMTIIDAGGSHEENPYEGVQMGVDSQGTPNLIEEGEVVYNDYVYSNRIECDPITKEKFHLPKKKEMTYADLAKKLEKEIAERPNDPISNAGFKAQMNALAEEQERQKAEMKAEKAKAAFEAMSPEEQTALMQRAAEEEAARENLAAQEQMAQEQAMQGEPVNTEGEIQQAEPAVTSEMQPMAEGGKLYDDGGFLDWWNKYVTSPLSQGKVKDIDYGKLYQSFFPRNGVTKSNEVQAELAKLYQHRPEYFAPYDIATYTFNGKAVPDFSTEATIPEVVIKPEELDVQPVKPLDYTEVADSKVETPVMPTVALTPQAEPEGTGDKVVPVLRKEWPRYAGLFGPAVGLGLMGLGVGRPDYSGLDAALEMSNQETTLADYKPLGNYLTYKPMDIWAEQNRLDASARATDRAIRNSNSPSRMAGLIANGYNSQLASGDLYRKALEYNDALRNQVASFNRGTDQFNAEAYNRVALTNAELANKQRTARANLAAQIAAQKMDADAGWYNSLYGNVAGLFKGIGDLGRENAERNWIARLAASGALPGITPDNAMNAGLVEYASNKKNKKRSLTI